MSVALAAKAVTRTFNKKERIIQATLSGNYATGGDTVNLGSVSNPKYLNDANFGYPGNIEDYEVLSCPTGYVGELIPGTTLNNWKIKFSQTGAALSGPLAEIAAAAYPGALTGGTVLLRFRGPVGQI